MDYQFRFDVVIPWIPYFLGGLGVTIVIAVLSMAAGAALGLLLATLRIAHVRVLGTLAAAFIDLFRTTPGLTQVLWVVYVIPIMIGYTPPAFWAGWLALTLNLSAFMAEIFRAGIESVSRGQWEAAGALGMSRRKIYERVVLPQALRRVIPPTASTWVSLFRDTSILSLVGVAELSIAPARRATPPIARWRCSRSLRSCMSRSACRRRAGPIGCTSGCASSSRDREESPWSGPSSTTPACSPAGR